MTEPTGPDPRPDSRPPRHLPRRARVAIVAVTGVLLVAAVLITLAAVPSVLPEPRTLAHDPVPAERIHWSTPPGCGIRPATLKALVPDGTVDDNGGGTCRWFGDEEKSGDRWLKVAITAHHAGPGVPGVTDAGNSSVAAAITALGTGTVYQGATVTPLTGLGDEAFVSETPSSSGRFADVSFRTGNVTVQAEYTTSGNPDADTPQWKGRLRAGALRAASDVARAVGAPDVPKIQTPPSHPAKVRTPRSACDVVPSGLRDRLLGEDGQEVDPGGQDDDPYLAGSLLRGARDQSCDLSTDTRHLTVTITTSTKPTAVRDTAREYLRRHLDARAEKPLTGDDDRYFHALSGLGDQAFCAYLEESSSVHDAESPARVVVRIGPALIGVEYGADTAGYTDDPLTEDEAVDGAYAIAVRAARAVHR